MRIKGETPEEMAGFLDATHARLNHLPDGERPLIVLPSYNGARKLPVLTPLLALLLAILAVLPKYRPLRLTTVELPSNFNLLFFGHFAELSRERYLAEIAPTLKPDGSIYAAMATDI